MIADEISSPPAAPNAMPKANRTCHPIAMQARELGSDIEQVENGGGDVGDEWRGGEKYAITTQSPLPDKFPDSARRPRPARRRSRKTALGVLMADERKTALQSKANRQETVHLEIRNSEDRCNECDRSKCPTVPANNQIPLPNEIS